MFVAMSLLSRVLVVACFLAHFSTTPAAAQSVDESPLPVTCQEVLTRLEVARPILLIHAGDGSNRAFIASQLGKVYALPLGPGDQNLDGREHHLFLDISSRVVYKDNENEEGFLGMAFHPRYKQTGEFFVYYTTTAAPHTSVISRFRVSKDDPNRADPDFEEEILRIPQPFWNHNGGTIVFGPDGYLYIGLGDGGAANDPFGHGQNLGTLLGSILRIDIDRKDPGKNYAIPKDNPFVGKTGACGEIWAYGLRNVWRMAFDPATGLLWAADVGQDTWEEINLIHRGGNYGWNLREGKHPFGRFGAGPRDDLVEPIWEYHHDLGKSITGGHVYRGKRVPELVGHYMYADYVTGRIWALKYDPKQGVTANRPIPGNIFPVMSFGEDEAGEVYFMRPEGKLYRFVRQEK
jgi:quinoprotein glucose dehydrogenase